MTTSRKPSEAYPRSGMCECVRIQLCHLYTCYGELRFDFTFQISLVMHSLVNIHLTVKYCAESKAMLLQGVGYLHRQKQPLKSKLREN